MFRFTDIEEYVIGADFANRRICEVNTYVLGKISSEGVLEIIKSEQIKDSDEFEKTIEKLSEEYNALIIKD